jgi:cell division transport system ATP-binding protein
MIEFQNVWKTYPTGKEALKNVSFKIFPEEMAFLIGHSGAGKSTIFRLVAAMTQTSKGRVVIAKQDITRLPRSVIPMFRRHIGLVFQDPMLLDHLTLVENVALPLVIEGRSEKEAQRMAMGALDLVGLYDQSRSLPFNLSTGEQQRGGLARAIVTRPKILLADEPTGNLDPVLSRKILELIQQINRSGTTVLMATHDQSLIQRTPFRCFKLDHGVML